ncbi:hypothetical protein L6R29_02955 [Myxococcota bacterium]|nr:hypothetical protein [Myxococcota bacterium]
MQTETIEISLLLAEAFDRLGVEYLVGGSLASSMHGIPRSTQDVDFVAALELRHIPALVKLLQSAFYIDADLIKEAIQRTSSFNVIHLATMFKADIFIMPQTPEAIEEMKRRQRVLLDETTSTALYLASPEDTILHKLRWFRMGGGVSERQWHDILGVLQVQASHLDLAYLRQAATQRNLLPLLEKSLTDAGLPQKCE